MLSPVAGPSPSQADFGRFDGVVVMRPFAAPDGAIITTEPPRALCTRRPSATDGGKQGLIEMVVSTIPLPRARPSCSPNVGRRCDRAEDHVGDLSPGGLHGEDLGVGPRMVEGATASANPLAMRCLFAAFDERRRSRGRALRGAVRTIAILSVARGPTIARRARSGRSPIKRDVGHLERVFQTPSVVRSLAR
jgi:hypothetical protein